MTLSRRNLFKMFAALPFVGVTTMIKTKHPLLLDGSIRYMNGKIERFGGWHIGPNQRAKYRWVDTGKIADWIKKHSEWGIKLEDLS